jgi:hypothetical protein
MLGREEMERDTQIHGCKLSVLASFWKEQKSVLHIFVSFLFRLSWVL